MAKREEVMAASSVLEKAAAARGLEVVDRGQGHFQIKGGPLLVNYYPLAKRKSAYVAGTTGRRVGVTPEQAVEMAFIPPSIKGVPRVEKRRGKYRDDKRKMMAVDPHCHWCRERLTMKIGAPNQATLDHRIPLALGGLDNANNWVLACEKCNRDRGCEMPELRG